MLYVVDASFILSFLLPDERSCSADILEKFRQNKVEFIAPNLLTLEVGNVLKTAVKSSRISAKTARELFDKFLDMDILYEDPDSAFALEIALKHNISYYDAVYMALAFGSGYKLLTLDSTLKKLVEN